MRYIVKKLGNELDKIKSCFDFLVENKYREEFVQCSHEDVDMIYENLTRRTSMSTIFTTTLSTLQCKCKRWKISSWFNDECPAFDGCGDWHVDTPNYAMIISAYPNTTDIFIPTDPSILNRELIKNQEELYDDLIDRHICDGKGYILKPEIGDVYYLGAGVIHRADRNSIGNPHLVIRKWIDRRGSWHVKCQKTTKTKSNSATEVFA